MIIKGTCKANLKIVIIEEYTNNDEEIEMIAEEIKKKKITKQGEKVK